MDFSSYARSKAASTSLSTHGLLIELADSTITNLSLRKISRSIVGRILPPTGKSSGANQHLTPFSCRLE